MHDRSMVGSYIFEAGDNISILSLLVECTMVLVYLNTLLDVMCTILGCHMHNSPSIVLVLVVVIIVAATTTDAQHRKPIDSFC